MWIYHNYVLLIFKKKLYHAKLLLVEIRFLLELMKMFYNGLKLWLLNSKCTKNHQIIYFKYMNYVNKSVIKNYHTIFSLYKLLF